MSELENLQRLIAERNFENEQLKRDMRTLRGEKYRLEIRIESMAKNILWLLELARQSTDMKLDALERRALEADDAST